MSDQTLRDAARLLRAGAPLEPFLDSLGGSTETALRIALMHRHVRAFAVNHRRPTRVEIRADYVVGLDGSSRLEDESMHIRSELPGEMTAGYVRRRDARRAAGEAREGSCLDREAWGPQGDACTCCQTWGPDLERCPCRCPLCNEVADHLAACRRCPGDPCSRLMAERLGLVPAPVTRAAGEVS